MRPAHPPRTVPPAHLATAAEALIHARCTGQWVEQTFHIHQASEANFINEVVATALQWHGADAARHWKSGGPARGAELSHAALDPQGVWTSPARAPQSPPWPLHHGGAEAEIALRLAADVDAELAEGLTQAKTPRLVDAVCVAIEVLSSRLAQPALASPWDRMADAQSHGALVLGPWVPWQAVADVDWRVQCGELQVNGEPPKRFAGTHSLGNPFQVLPDWLRHATREGRVLRAGTVVTTGNWSGETRVQPGDWVCARFQGLGEATVQL